MARTRKILPIRTERESKRSIPSQEEILGRNLAAAFIATQHGIGMDYTRKKYAHEPVGAFWISLARTIIEHFQHHPVLPPPSPTRIQ